MNFLYQPKAWLSALVQPDMNQGRMILPQPRYGKTFVLNMPGQFGQRGAYSRISGPQTRQLSCFIRGGESSVSERRGKGGSSFLCCQGVRRWAEIQVNRGSALRDARPGHRIRG
jgi:hypothetical protein